MGNNILIDPGIVPFQNIIMYIENLTDLFTVHIINDNPKKNGWNNLDGKAKFYLYDNLRNNCKSKYAYNKDFNPIELINNIINDHQTLLIYERVIKQKALEPTRKLAGWNSLFIGVMEIERIVFNCVSLLESVDPKFLIFQATPHNISSWILAKVAEFFNIDVFFIQTSPLPWRYMIVKGLQLQNPIYPVGGNYYCHEDVLALKEFININRKSYNEAIPKYEKERFAKRNGQCWSWEKEISDIIKHPRNIFRIIPKKHLYDVYTKLSQPITFGINYITVFLHFQPERTSIPEGGLFSQQLLIIRLLSSTIPDNWTLLVKEHPSTFMGNFDSRYRNPQFYREISEIPRVKIVPILADTFKLIDASKAIVTITGTVGIQALIRGIPVIVFGPASYRNAPGVYTVTDYKGLKRIIEKIVAFGIDFKLEEIDNYLKEVLKNSETATDSKTVITNNFYSEQIRLAGNGKILGDFLNSKGLY